MTMKRFSVFRETVLLKLTYSSSAKFTDFCYKSMPAKR